MSFAVRYTGSFGALKRPGTLEGAKYRIEILQEGCKGVVTEVKMGADPVFIEWGDTDKLEPVQSSCATIQLYSKSDRQFVDLYTVQPGTIRLDVYRDNMIYWSGMLDPELYSEPYSYKSGYIVEFTFSDFAILDRSGWTSKETMSIQQIIDDCLMGTGINYTELVKLISTREHDYDTSPIDLSNLNLLCENFFDEDDEAMTKREVLDEVLRPFALRMTQRNGKIYLYDLNAIFADQATEPVKWFGTDAMLEASETYNNVKLTFSPYADAKMVDERLDHGEVLKGQGGTMFKVDNDWQNTVDGFRIVNGDQSDLPLTLANGAKFYRIDSEYSGGDEAGVAYAYKGSYSGNYDQFLLNGHFPRVFDPSSGAVLSKPIISCPMAFLGHVGNQSDYQLRISLNVLFDTRYNPFEGESVKNEKGNYERLKDWCNFGYVPCMLNLKDVNGNILYHFVNKGVMNSNSYEHGSKCYWRAGAGSWGDMFLCYYNKEDRKGASGFGGWQKNRQIIGYYRDELPKKWEKLQDGEYIPLPPVGGFLEFTIGSGIHQFDYKRETKDIYSIARWLLYKEPKIELVQRNGRDYEQEDLEDTAWINKSAKEDLSIDTIVGTLGEKHTCPSARGLIMRSDHSAVNTFWRAGVTDRLEHLLIGTVYSQYAQRNDVLSGRVRLLPEFKVLTDANSESKYMLLSERQDLKGDASDIKMVRFREDNYSGVEYK